MIIPIKDSQNDWTQSYQSLVYIFYISSQFRLVVKTTLKLLLVFVEYSESNAPLLIEAITSVDTKKGTDDFTLPQIRNLFALIVMYANVMSSLKDRVYKKYRVRGVWLSRNNTACVFNGEWTHGYQWTDLQAPSHGPMLWRSYMRRMEWTQSCWSMP